MALNYINPQPDFPHSKCSMNINLIDLECTSYWGRNNYKKNINLYILDNTFRSTAFLDPHSLLVKKAGHTY